MPDNFPGIVMMLLMVALYLLVFWRKIGNFFAPQRSVKACVVRKNTVDIMDKYKASGKRKRYVIHFEAEGKRLSFYVSEFSYGGYRVGEKGTLTYKGDRLIGFE